MNSPTEKTDVLIAGLGPVGAVLAVYLGRLGVNVIAIERDKGVYPVPRAAHLDHETMRLLHLAGGAEAAVGHLMNSVAGCDGFGSDPRVRQNRT